MKDELPFNFQRLMNLGALHAQGKFLLLLNNDIVFTEKSNGILTSMKTYAQKPDVGAVGPLLLYEDGTIQHAGVVVGMDHYAEHLYRTWTREEASCFNFTPYNVDRVVSAVTAAFLMVEKEKYNKVHGFNEQFIICGGDVDFCLRLASLGFQNIYLGTKEAVHLESKSRDTLPIPEVDFIESNKSYNHYLALHEGRDPFYPAPLPLTHKKQVVLTPEMKEKITPASVWHKLKHGFNQNPIEVFLAKSILKIGIMTRGLWNKNTPAITTQQHAVPYTHFDITETRPIQTHQEFPLNPGPRINILLPHLQDSLIYGGVATAVIIGLKLKLKYPHLNLRFCLTDLGGNRSSLEKAMFPYFGQQLHDIPMEIVEVYDRTSMSLPVHRNDIFLATIWWSCYSAIKAQPDKPYIYLIQDYESCFYPWSNQFAACEATYSMNFIPIFNTSILRDFFLKRELIPHSVVKNGAYFNPAIGEKFFHVQKTPKLPNQKRIFFFYGRPETPRNLFGIALKSLSEALQQGIFNPQEWKFISAGEAHPPIALPQGATLNSVGKLSFEEYIQFLSTVDIGMSLMLSPHPSYPPLEIAAAGALCVTNSYENKDLSLLHANIISCPPSISGLQKGLAEAVARLNNGHIQHTKLVADTVPLESNWDAALSNTLECIYQHTLQLQT